VFTFPPLSLFNELTIYSQLYQKAKEDAAEKERAAQAQDDEELTKPSNGRRHGAGKPAADPLAPSTQGALILQSMLRLSEASNKVVLDRFALVVCFLICSFNQTALP
jgi:hypothetical protein